MDEIKEEEFKLKKAEITAYAEGLCDNCGAFGQLLRVEDTLLCEDCRDNMY